MKLRWDPANKEETDFAEKIYRHAVEKPEKSGVPKAKAFKVGRGGKQGKEITAFDRAAREITVVFP